MAPHTADGLASRMAHGGHIHCENYGFIDANGPASTSTFSHSLGLHLRNLGPVAHGGQTPRTTHGGCISEYTYLEGLVPSLIASHGQVSHLRNQRTTAHDELAQGMASIDHILLWNHTVNHTKGPAPASALSHGLDLHLRNMGPMAYGRHNPRTALGAVSQSAPVKGA
jgi:hypothetical protein